jgi:hypothetical protein
MIKDNPRYFHVASDREGFFIEDDEGEEVMHWPGWDAPTYRWLSHQTAECELDRIVAEYGQIEEQERAEQEAETRRHLENEAMGEHFRKHPHG